MTKKCLSLAMWIVAFQLISFGIGMMTQGDVDGWYESLTRPPLVPPNMAFPIVWTILYTMIASAGWLLWRNRNLPDGDFRLVMFGIYMVLNWAWSFIFFTAHLLLPGFLWIILMNAVALALIWLTWNGVRNAALLMIPPTIWTTYAAYLNGGFWWLNG